MGVSTMHLITASLKLLFGLAVLAVEVVCWFVVGIGYTLRLTGEVIGARRRLAGGLHCPRGHSVPIFGTYECGRCHIRYEGSVWRCPNPECHAVTPYASCPVCRLGVRNPYRLEGGRGR